jgi:hypothetical protein
MMRIKLFGLFIAFALLALVRPRKCLELLEAADAGAAARQNEDLIARQNAFVQRADDGPEFTVDDPDLDALLNAVADWKTSPQNMDTGLHMMSLLERVEERLKATAQECPLPPAGWRCTRRAGHDGPCAAVVKV